jgi:hypothetical protein
MKFRGNVETDRSPAVVMALPKARSSVLPFHSTRRASPSPFVPVPAAVHDCNHRRHDRNFNEHADNGCDSGTRLEAEQRIAAATASRRPATQRRSPTKRFKASISINSFCFGIARSSFSKSKLTKDEPLRKAANKVLDQAFCSMGVALPISSTLLWSESMSRLFIGSAVKIEMRL